MSREKAIEVKRSQHILWRFCFFLENIFDKMYSSMRFKNNIAHFESLRTASCRLIWEHLSYHLLPHHLLLFIHVLGCFIILKKFSFLEPNPNCRNIYYTCKSFLCFFDCWQWNKSCFWRVNKAYLNLVASIKLIPPFKTQTFSMG